MPGTRLDREDILDALRDVLDPEVGTSIVELGLVYDVSISEGTVTIDMTTTTRFCPVSQLLVDAASARVGLLSNVSKVVVNLVYDPPWSAGMMDAFHPEHR